MQELVTTQSILAYLQEKVEQKEILAPSVWVDAAMKLSALVGNENDKLFELQQKVAEKRVEIIKGGESVAKAKAIVEASDEYKEFHQHKARIEQIWELVRIAKLRARTTSEEMRS